MIYIHHEILTTLSAVDSGGAGGARAPPEFGGLEKGRSLISAYRSLAITMNTPGFKKLSTALRWVMEFLTRGYKITDKMNGLQGYCCIL